MDTIEKMQTAPLKTRRMLFALFMVSGMVVVLGLWTIQLKFVTTSKTTDASTSAERREAGPGSVLWGSVRSLWSKNDNKKPEFIKVP